MIPAVLAHYRIVRPIGAGGMGEVFLAEDTKLRRQVALKILRPRARPPIPTAAPGSSARHAPLAALNHPNIVTIHSVEEPDGILFLTIELVEGQTLD